MTQTEQTWPHKFDVAVNPAARRPLMYFGGVVALAVILFVGGGILEDYSRTQQTKSLVPHMSALAAKGIPEAVAWMTKNEEGYYMSPEGKAQLKLAAEAGHPQSMFFYASLNRRENPDLAMDYLQKAAAAGYASAVRMKDKWEQSAE